MHLTKDIVEQIPHLQGLHVTYSDFLQHPTKQLIEQFPGRLKQYCNMQGNRR